MGDHSGTSRERKAGLVQEEQNIKPINNKKIFCMRKRAELISLMDAAN